MQAAVVGERGQASGTNRGEMASLIVPRAAAELAAHYDLTISHPDIDQPQFVVFEGWLAQAAAERGLTCALIHAGVIDEVLRRLVEGRLTIGYHLDYFAMWHLPDDPYARLAQAVQDTGGHPVNLPARARAFTDKANTHAELQRHGLGVPATVLVRPWHGDRPLSPGERRRLRLDEEGAGVYVKPANGFGGRGVVRVERPDDAALAAALSQARAYDPNDTYLIQREVRPPLLTGEDGVARPAYWRILDCLGERFAYWWTPPERLGPGQPSYRRLTALEVRRLRLGPLFEYMDLLAELSGLQWFSTELCLGAAAEPGRFSVTSPEGRDLPVLAIDYLNDQCDVEVQSRWAGATPDADVLRMARRFADAAWGVRQSALRPQACYALRVG
jgi:hypothetical protein